MKLQHIAIAAMAAALTPSAFASQQTVSQLDALKVENLKLVKKGANMVINFDIDFSDIKLGRNQQIIYTPVFAGEGDSIVMEKVVLNGKNVAMKELREPERIIKDALTIVRENGTPQSINVSTTVPYQDWMNYSQLYLSENVCGCGDLKNQDRLPIGEFDNRQAPRPQMTFVTPKAEAVKARDEKGSAFVDYVVNRTNILPDYRNNQREIAKIIKTIDLVKNDPNVSITQINIHGFASPEGAYDNNVRLAEGRSASLKDYVRSLYTLPENIFTSNSTPEDWEGLRKLVEASNIENREGILQIIDSDMDLDKKDHTIRAQYPRSYQFMLKEWYPGLRHSDYTVSYVVRPFTVEETKEIMKKTPKQVSLNEMFLVAQTLKPGSPEFNEIMDIAVKTYPDDQTANLNAACAALNEQQWTKAAEYLKKAGTSPEAMLARGVLAMNEKKYDEAERYLKIAQQQGVPTAENNLKIVARLRTLAAQNQ